MRSEKPICAPPRLSEFPPTLPLKQFKCSSDWLWPSFVLSRKIGWCFLCSHLSSRQLMMLCPWLCALSSISSSSTFQIFQDANLLVGLLCAPVYLLGRFPLLRHVHGSTPTGVFEIGCWTLTHASLRFLFYIFLFCNKLIESSMARQKCC